MRIERNLRPLVALKNIILFHFISEEQKKNLIKNKRKGRHFMRREAVTIKLLGDFYFTAGNKHEEYERQRRGTERYK